MSKRLLGLLLLLPLLGAAQAWGATPSRPQVPSRGMTMKQVRARFGPPERKRAPVGHPPMTRWDYPHFIVVFEHNIVHHAVVPSDPPKLYHRNQLKRVHTAPPTHR